MKLNTLLLSVLIFSVFLGFGYARILNPHFDTAIHTQVLAVDDDDWDGPYDPPGGSGGTQDDPLNFKNFMGVLYGILFPVVVILGFLKVVVAGYTIMTSQGDPQKIQEGKEDLTAAIMGLIFILGAVGILRILIGSIITGGDPGF
uniref:Uncharacterized protein n=1 Tax=candidate division WWE3 bacterium TaxID=2053526 RepID=A0A7C4TJJ6_UNCKA